MSLSLIAASIAAGLIHVALGPEHVAELGWLGGGFYLAGALQLGWAGLALVTIRTGTDDRPGISGGAIRRAITPSGVAINGAILAAWLLSRTVGLPAGDQPWTPEAIGISDTITALFEAGLVLGLAVTWRRGRSGPLGMDAPSSSGDAPSLVGAAPILALILVATVTAIGTPHAHAGAGAHDAGVESLEQGPHTH